MDEQLYLLAVGLSLDEKIEKAIANLCHYEKEALARDPENGYYLCDSYGKDSCVILHLAKLAGVKFKAHHNLTTLDPPELIQFGRKHHPETIVHRPEKPLLSAMLDPANGRPPMRNARWCCRLYKEHGGDGMVKVTGIRAAESARRASRWKVWTPNKRSGWFLNPILYWSDNDLWRYIRAENIQYCCLYDEGLSRLGCIGCPMGGTRQQTDQFKRWPKYEEGWKRWVRRFWVKYHGKPLSRPTRLPDGTLTTVRWCDRLGFSGWEDLWNWWLYEPPKPDVDDCQMGLF